MSCVVFLWASTLYIHYNRVYQRNKTCISAILYCYIIVLSYMRKKRANERTTITSTDKINVLGIITERANRYQWFQSGHNLIKKAPATTITTTFQRTATDFVTLCIIYNIRIFDDPPFCCVRCSTSCFYQVAVIVFCSANSIVVVVVVYVPILFFFRSS